MAEHMQAVKTTWIIEYKCAESIVRLSESDQNKLQETLMHIRDRGTRIVIMTETRTCDAMPGVAYTKTSTVDLDLLLQHK